MESAPSLSPAIILIFFAMMPTDAHTDSRNTDSSEVSGPCASDQRERNICDESFKLAELFALHRSLHLFNCIHFIDRILFEQILRFGTCQP